ncbi:putative Dol-P-Glc:Glc(2)Man(9)GlcNAc(2)-PP-Dol alpha-1,2-glucosyltransferase isoform X2 [Cimex lectularius]|uniref:Dol-P-Glc:Glc(2)Man(9)GlcNAc(2)-PP-Dol alpha-1,2-glucosyltransferase n=1 Tax=Cimex lectularius TaxID=79782 RepID=A0A8I6RT03_CIMLE|nr:putative Dol-P-Glc:Glc(2)Man(9)GlcNAc(2)-PP-Dol alpha-1,2-glucosyltransferase isoform X2 [Cimex lectularius]
MVCKWDPKITTLPGLYILSMALHTVFGIPCTVFFLRLTNIMISYLNFCLIHNIFSCLCTSRKVPKKNSFVTWNTINTAFFPVMYFFNFLYYTESVSTLFVLAAYSCSLNKKYWLSAMFGFLSITVRQTNVAWVGFLMVAHVIDYMAIDIPFVRRYLNIILNQGLLKAVDYLVKKEKIYDRLEILFSNIIGYFFVCLLFLVFLAWNRGIVVGDRTAHEPVIHLCQIFYFAVFVLVFKPSLFFSKIKCFIAALKRNVFLSVLCLGVISLIVHVNTMAHLYLLSDNRHYSFYLWRFYCAVSSKAPFVFVPLFMFGLYSIESIINFYPWKYAYYFSMGLLIIPQKLLDFRYYILPFVFLRLQILKDEWWQLAIESLAIIVINTVFLYIFVTKEIYWVDFKEPQRLIW